MMCPYCQTEMMIQAKLSLKDIFSQMKTKTATGKIGKPNEDQITGYICSDCGFTEKK